MVGKISLVNFRSYAKKDFDLKQRNLVMGKNGSGKSNLIEAIYLMATGKSFRADTELEMLRYSEVFCLVNGFADEDLDIKVTLTDGSVGGARKKFEVNGVPRRMVDAVGKIRAVLFGPADMDLVTGSPSIRRRYLDFVISQKDREYRRCLLSYEKGLRQRNKLLDFIRDGRAGRTQLWFWDRLLIKDGEYLTRKRQEYLESLNNEIYEVFYDKSIISELRLAQYEVQEVAAGTTLVGPHRDNFVIKVGTSLLHLSPNSSLRLASGAVGERDLRDVAKYGSRGEQRMAVWWLKQNEIKYLTDEENTPILLLDDIFSELDHRHRENVLEIASKYQGQVVMTSAEEELVFDKAGWHIINLDNSPL